MDKTLDLAVKFIDNTHSGSNSDLFNLASISAESAPTFDFFGVIICFFLIALLLAGSVLFYKYFNSVKNKSYVSSAKHVNPTFRYSKNQGFNKFQKCLIIGIFAIASVLLVAGCFKFGSTAFADPSTNTITNDSIAIDKDTIVATIDEEHNVTFDTFSLSSVSSRDLRIMSVSVNESDYAKEISAFEGSKINIYGFDACLYAGAPDGLPYDTSTMDKLKPGDSSVAFLAIENYDIDKLIQLSEKDALTITFNTSDLYNVDFDVQGHGVAPEKQSVLEGDKVVHPATDPIETGYTFGGWYKESSCDNEWDFDTEEVFEDTTIYAKWTANTYTIKANAEDGSFPDGAVTELQYTYDGDDVPTSGFTNPVKTGYNATGWSSSIGGTVSINVINKGNLVELGCNLDDESVVGNVYVIWSAKTTEVMLDPTDGEPGDVTSVTATYDSDMPALTGGSDLPTRDGYSFYGYFDASTGGNQYYQSDGTSTCIWDKEDSTVTLYAQWVPSVTIITLNANGGTDGSTKQVTGVYGSAMPSIDISCLPTRTGYDFDGFFDAQEGGKKYYNNDGTSANNWDKEGATSTLYAQWKGVAVKTTFIFDIEGGTTSDIIQTYGSNYILPSNNPYGESLCFTGWSLTDGTTIDEDSIVNTTEEHLINANYQTTSITLQPLINEISDSNLRFENLLYKLNGPVNEDLSAFSKDETGTFIMNSGDVVTSDELTILAPKNSLNYKISVYSSNNKEGAVKTIPISSADISEDPYLASFQDSERADVKLVGSCLEAEDSETVSCGFTEYGNTQFLKTKDLLTGIKFLDSPTVQNSISAMCIAPFGFKYDPFTMSYASDITKNFKYGNQSQLISILDEGSFDEGYSTIVNPIIKPITESFALGAETVDQGLTSVDIAPVKKNESYQFCCYNVNSGSDNLELSPVLITSFSNGDNLYIRSDRWIDTIPSSEWSWKSNWAPTNDDNSSVDWARWKRASSKCKMRVFAYNDQLSTEHAYYCMFVFNDIDNPSEQFVLQFKVGGNRVLSQSNDINIKFQNNRCYDWFNGLSEGTTYPTTEKMFTVTADPLVENEENGHHYLFRTAEDCPEGWSVGENNKLTKSVPDGIPLKTVMLSLGRPLLDKYDDPDILSTGLSGEWIYLEPGNTVKKDLTLNVNTSPGNLIVDGIGSWHYQRFSDIWDIQKGHTLSFKYIIDNNKTANPWENPYLYFTPRRTTSAYGADNQGVKFWSEPWRPWFNFRSDVTGTYGKYGDTFNSSTPHRLDITAQGITIGDDGEFCKKDIGKLLDGEICTLSVSFTEDNHVKAIFQYTGCNRSGDNKDVPFSFTYDMYLNEGGDDLGAITVNKNLYFYFSEEFSRQDFIGDYVEDWDE